MSITDPQSQTSYPDIANSNIHTVNDFDIGSPNSTVTTDYNQRILPRQISSAALRGTQSVGYGNVKIDGSNNQIVFGSDQYTKGSTMTIGAFTETLVTNVKELGFKIDDFEGFTLFRMDGQTWFWYDKSTGNNIMQVGKLPDGTFGWAVATPGHDVSESFV